MSDLLGLGGNGVLAYQRALVTVSNNIANVATEGYSRQQVDLQSLPARHTGRGYLGTGVAVSAVRRNYDEFVESNLRQAVSNLEGQQPLTTYTDRVVDLLAGADTGLTTAMNRFFESARAITVDPASPIVRAAFLGEAGAMVNAFKALNAQFAALDEETRSGLDTAVSQVNTLAGQLALVNTQLHKQPELARQPAELLDQRDRLLRELASHAQLKTAFEPNGEVSVTLTDSFSRGTIVARGEAFALSSFHVEATGHVDLQIGALDGRLQVRTRSGLATDVDRINRLIEELALTNRRLQERTTLDAQPAELLEQRDRLLRELDALVQIESRYQTDGQVTVSLGGDLARGLVVDRDRAIPVGGVQVPETDRVELQLGRRSLLGVSGGDIGGLIAFREQVLAPSRARLDEFARAFAQGVNAAHRGGIDALGRPGQDLFELPTAGRAADGLALRITDPQQVAAAGLFRAVAQAANLGTATATVSYREPALAQPAGIDGLYPSSGLESAPRTLDIGLSHRVVGTLSAGMRDAAVYLDPATGQWPQVLTRDGRHLLGSSLSAQLQEDILKTAGMDAGALYDDSYLNRGGTATPRVETGPLTLPWPADLPAGAFTMNGTALPALVAPTTIDQVASWINSVVDTTGVRASIAADRLVLTAEAPATEIRLVPGTGPGPGIGAPATAADLARLGLPAQGGIAGAYLGGDYFVGALAQPTRVPVYDPRNGVAVSTSIAPARLDSGPVSVNWATGLAAGAFTLNGVSMPALAPPASVQDIADWINGTTVLTKVSARAEQLIRLPSDTVFDENLAGSQLTLTSTGNGTATITAPAGGFASVHALAEAINAQAAISGVRADVSPQGDLLLSNPDADSVTIGGQLLAINGSFGGQLTLVAQDTTTDIRLAPGPGLGAATAGTPSDLARMGLRTGVHWLGELPEDLVVVVSGAGVAEVSAAYRSDPGFDLTEAMRARRYQVEFLSASRYVIRDVTAGAYPGTAVAERNYDATDPDAVIAYRGIEMRLSGAPVKGDRFIIDGNRSGVGDNRAMLVLATLDEAALLPGGLTIAEGYLQHAGRVGAVSRQATIATEALAVVRDQAVQAREAVAGVNLDEEAADLIRLQQAYQANARVMQAATTMFDTLLAIR